MQLPKSEILEVPDIKNVITDSDSDMSCGHDLEDVVMYTPDSPPDLPATLSPPPQADDATGRSRVSVPIEIPTASPLMPSCKLVGLEPTLFQARTTPAKHTHSYNHDVVIAENYEEKDVPYVRSP